MKPGGCARPVMTQRAIGNYFFVTSLLVLSACASTNRVELESENQNSRIRMVVIHHTTSGFQRALDALTLPSDRPEELERLLNDANSGTGKKP